MFCTYPSSLHSDVQRIEHQPNSWSKNSTSDPCDRSRRCSSVHGLPRIHSWASAFRHSVSQSIFRYWTGIPYSATELVPASAFLFIPVPYWLDAGQSDIPAFKKGYILHVHTASVSPASAFLPVVSCLSLASVFRNHGSVRYRWSRIIPALSSSARVVYCTVQYSTNVKIPLFANWLIIFT